MTVAYDRPGDDMSFPHDSRIALANKIFRTHVVPVLPDGEGACLMIFDVNSKGLMTYISNCERADMRLALRELLTKWDREAGE